MGGAAAAAAVRGVAREKPFGADVRESARDATDSEGDDRDAGLFQQQQLVDVSGDGDGAASKDTDTKPAEEATWAAGPYKRSLF